MHIKDEPHGHHVGKKNAPAIADKGEGQSGNGHQADGHADILKHLEDQEADHATHDIGSEGIVGRQGDLDQTVNQEESKGPSKDWFR